ncbi:MAG: hypothetical protein V7K72_21865 [Nostoc sp.]|uniref:hypothetical protein n=1 Tax=Nostoc sp. TaxID=1180 RepID=UPI002FFCA56B
MLNFILIANPENRRVGFFQQAIAHFNLPPATVVDYADLIAGKQTLEQFNIPNTIIRFDSPEKNFDVDKAIIAEGSREIFSTSSHQHISAEAATKLAQTEREERRI